MPRATRRGRRGRAYTLSDLWRWQAFTGVWLDWDAVSPQLREQAANCLLRRLRRDWASESGRLHPAMRDAIERERRDGMRMPRPEGGWGRWPPIIGPCPCGVADCTPSWGSLHR